eukprot:10067901-Prorocentrum_lima.AAC.1
MVLLQQLGGGGASILAVVGEPGCVLLCACACGWLLSICGAIQRLCCAMRGAPLRYLRWIPVDGVESRGAHLRL